MSHYDGSSAPANSGRVVESAGQQPGKIERPSILPRDLIYLVAGRFYSEHYSGDVNMLPWSIEKALNLWNALDEEIRDRGWMDLLEVAK